MPMRFPFYIDGRGCTATAAETDDGYVRDLLEHVLLTTPGERINRPDFGSGLLGMAFSPGGEAMQAALQATVQASLQRLLSDFILVQSVEVEVEEATAFITVQYVVRRTQEPQVARFSQSLDEGLL
jgi:phage baseplate assembly protein W